MHRILTALLLLTGLAGCFSDEDDQRPLRFGYAEVDLTPPVGTILGGFGYPGGTRKSTADHDPQYGQAALFVNGQGQSFLLLTLDSAGYLYDFGDWGPGVAVLRQRISEALQGQVNIEPEHVLLTSSHTHAGTDLMGFWVRAGEGPDKDLLDQHITELTRISVEAADALAPAELWLGRTALPGVAKRDGPCSDVTDDSVEILQVRAPDGTVQVTIAAYALHPTFSGYDNTESSSDFVWGFREEMTAATGGPAMYLQGAIAAVHEVGESVPGEGWERVYAMGRILADAVLAAEPGFERATEHGIEHRHQMFESVCVGDYMVTMYELFDMPKRYVEERGDEVIVSHLEVSWHRLGPAGFIGWPGEPTPEYSLALKARMGSTDHDIMVGLANDSIGYLIDEASIAKDTSGQLEDYELQMGCGQPIGPAAWEATEAMGWF